MRGRSLQAVELPQVRRMLNDLHKVRTRASDGALQLQERTAQTICSLPTIARGFGEDHSALLVNSVDVTDPATGGFGLSVPIDSVQTIEVSEMPYLAEYGRFTAGVGRGGYATRG